MQKFYFLVFISLQRIIYSTILSLIGFFSGFHYKDTNQIYRHANKKDLKIFLNFYREAMRHY